MEVYKKEYQSNKIIDFILIFILFIMDFVTIYEAYVLKMIPDKWLYSVSGIIIVLSIILALLIIKQLPRWVTYLKRFLIICMCIALGIASSYLNKIDNTIKEVSNTIVTDDGVVIVKNKLFIVTLDSDSAETLDDLKDCRIGFQNGSDIKHAEMIEDFLSKDKFTYEKVEMMDYTNLYQQLTNKQIRALAISETYYKMSLANIKDFKDNVRIVHTYEYEAESDQVITKDITKEVFTVYLSGLDNVGSPDQQTRTDTNLLLIVNPIANHIDMVSLPRDGLVPNSALNNGNDKLTHTGMYGIDCSVETIENFFNIPIDYYARVSFNSLIAIVDTIGGIDVDVEIDFCEQDENRSFKKKDLICLVSGKQTLNGKQALAYSRHRKTVGYDNAGRERAQQRVIKGIINKLLTPSAIGYVGDLLEIAPQYVITNMPSSQITSFVQSELDNIKPWTISSIKSDTGLYDTQYVASIAASDGKKDVYLFSKNEVQAVINAYYGASDIMNLESFSFDLNDLYKDCEPVNDDPNIIWDYMADNPH